MHPISLADITQRAQAHRAAGGQVVAVQGLGFVGAAVAAALASADGPDGRPRFMVIGLELDNPAGQAKVQAINQGRTPVAASDPRLQTETARGARERGNLVATTDPAAYGLAQVIVVDIPLDVKDRTVRGAQEVDIDARGFQAGLAAVGRHMAPEALVLVETTVPVGACRRLALPVLEEARQARGIAAPVRLGFAYERVMPGPRYLESIRNFWRTYAGIDEQSAQLTREFLASFIDTESFPPAQVECLEAAEMGKLLENSYRAANIAFIHEWTLLAEKVGVNLFEVVRAIRVRRGTHDNIRQPGFGVGGYCLTKDSLLAQWSASQLFDTGVELSMTLQGLGINYQMPLHTLDLARELADGDLGGVGLALLGVAYLADVGDTRNSPSELFVEQAQKAGARVGLHDPTIGQWPERPELALTEDLAACLAGARVVVAAVPHAPYRDLDLAGWLRLLAPGSLLVDACDLWDDATAQGLHQAGHRLLGVGKGHWRKRGYQCAI